MKPEDKSAVQSLVSDLNGLRSRSPEESKFKDWKDKAGRKLEDLFGKGSEQSGRFRAVKFFDFGRRGSLPKDAPLREEERAQYLRGLDDARRLLLRFTDQ
jgi:hypothetical protein